MSKPFRLAVVTVLALAVACVWHLQRPAAAQEKEKPKEPLPAAVTKWEYRYLLAHDGKEAEKELNKLGEEGFEIAFVNTTVSEDMNALGRPRPLSDVRIHYTLKRAKQ